MDPATQNEVAKRFKQMHVPGSPVVLVNVYDAASANKLLETKAAKAVGTASYAIAATQGVSDDDLTFEQNLAAIRTIGTVTSRAKIPLTVDVQDGYDDVAATIKAIIQAGAVGCNIEDLNNAKNTLRSKDEAANRIKLALKTARDAGVPDFVVNARSDVLNFDGTIGDALDRAQAYLAAGATTAFIWGGAKGRGLRTEEVKQLVDGLGGRLNVMMALGPNKLTVSELKEIGVARISVGPGAFMAAMKAFGETATALLKDS